MKTLRAYGWRPDAPDHRDRLRCIRPAAALPARIDLRPHCPPVYDQGNLGSCTANAIAAAVEFDQARQRHSAWRPSRLFVYYNERALEGTTASDSGAAIRDGFKTINAQGVCPETSWPYVEAKFAQRPGAKCYQAALRERSVVYQRLDSTNLSQLKGCLAGGFPFVFGFSVYQSFESAEVARTGVVPMPGTSEQLLGGHAVLAVGYDDARAGGAFLARNSWGAGWGLGGYFYIPYAYLTNPRLADDFWTVEKVA